MLFEVIVLPQAERQLENAIDWWRKNRANAQLLERELHAAIESLEMFPERGLGIPPSRQPVRRRILTKTTKFVVIYRVRPRLGRVEVTAIFDGRRRR